MLNTLSDGKVVIRKEGGDAPSGGGSKMRYFVPPADLKMVVQFCWLGKYIGGDTFYGILNPAVYLANHGNADSLFSNTIAFAVDVEMKMWMLSESGEATIISWRDMMMAAFGTDIIPMLTEITEEEFFDTNNLHI